LGKIDGPRTFVRSFGTSDLTTTNRKWSTYDSEYETKIQQARSLAVFQNSKDARREKFWTSEARWMEFLKERGGGQLRLPIQT
jgi:hypothetical protein